MQEGTLVLTSGCDAPYCDALWFIALIWVGRILVLAAFAWLIYRLARRTAKKNGEHKA